MLAINVPTVTTYKDRETDDIRSIAIVHGLMKSPGGFLIPTRFTFSGTNAQALRKFSYAVAYDIRPNSAYGIRVMPELVKGDKGEYYACEFTLVDLGENEVPSTFFGEYTGGAYRGVDIDPLAMVLAKKHSDRLALEAANKADGQLPAGD